MLKFLSIPLCSMMLRFLIDIVHAIFYSVIIFKQRILENPNKFLSLFLEIKTGLYY